MSTGAPWPEEPWELEIHELLAGLPPVDPPEGFIARAIDHRPKYAGRLTLLALASVVAATAAIVALGLVDPRVAVSPPLDALTARHLLFTPVGSDGEAMGSVLVDRDLFDPVTAPRLLEPVGAAASGELRHWVFDHGGQQVSVFVQPGRVAWETLPPDGLRRDGDRPMWVDDVERVVVLEVGDDAVTVVGLEPAEAVAVLADRRAPGVGLVDRLRALAAEVARQAGFP
jgi:hypothetical protein